MAKKLTDLSQLTKAILKESPPPCPVEKPAPEPPQSREDADAAAVLAYFSRPSQNAPQRNRAAPCAVPAKDRPVAPEAALEASVRQRPGHDVEDPVRLPGESQQRQRDREQVLLTMEEQEKRERPEKTPEELAEIAYLDKLRTCEGEEMPVGLPLACIVKVIGYEEVPKASEQYAMATVEGRDGRTWRLCIRRYYLEEGMRALFVSYDALLPEEDERFDNLDVCKLHERVFRFGFGVKERRKIPFVKRNVYHNNCGVLYPLDDFHELSKVKVGDDCSSALHIESAEDLRRKAAAPQPKKKAVFQPKSVKDDFLAKLRLHRKRYGW